MELIFLTCPSVKPPGGFRRHSDAVRPQPATQATAFVGRSGHAPFGRHQATACDLGHSVCWPLRGFRGLQDCHLAAVKTLKRPPQPSDAVRPQPRVRPQPLWAAQATVFGFRSLQDCHLAAVKTLKRPPGASDAVRPQPRVRPQPLWAAQATRHSDAIRPQPATWATAFVGRSGVLEAFKTAIWQPSKP